MDMLVNYITTNSQELKQLAAHHYNSYLPGRKSNLRLSDQLIPKPTDINIGEKIIKVATLREHPYASHIPQFAMFPSYCSSDGTAKAEQVGPILNSNVPNSPPDVILLSKTKGAAYRHEVMKPPTRTKKAVTWAGEQGFLEYPKPFKGESQVFYPTPTKMMLSKPKCYSPSSEETSNMLKNLEQTHWLTSYQMHYSGSEHRTTKTDDFKKKHSSLTGRNLHTAPLRETSVPAFVSSKLRERFGKTKDPRSGMISPTAQLSATFSAPLPRNVSAVAPPQRVQESSVHYNESPEPNQRGVSQLEHSSGSAGAQSNDLSHRGSYKQQAGGSECEDRTKEKGIGQSKREVSRDMDTESLQQNREKSSNGISGKDAHTSPNPCILPRPPVLPGIRPLSGNGMTSRLREFQDSFSKTQAHYKFNSSNTRTPVNLRDNVCTGRRHDFYGVNSFYLHG